MIDKRNIAKTNASALLLFYNTEPPKKLCLEGFSPESSIHEYALLAIIVIDLPLSARAAMSRTDLSTNIC